MITASENTSLSDDLGGAATVPINIQKRVRSLAYIRL